MGQARLGLTIACVLATLATAPLASSAATRPMPTSTPQPHLMCSNVYGCIVTVNCGGKRLSFAGVTDPVFDVHILNDGADGQPIRVGIIPKSSIVQYDNMYVLPPAARLDVITTKGASFAVLLQTVPYGPMNSLSLSCPGQTSFALADTPSPTPRPTGLAAIDPAKMDTAWSFQGDRMVKCTSIFSYQSQVWCKLPRTLNDAIPSAGAVENGQVRPLDTYVYNRDWLVIEGLASDIRLTWGLLGRSGDIVRSRE